MNRIGSTARAPAPCRRSRLPPRFAVSQLPTTQRHSPSGVNRPLRVRFNITRHSVANRPVHYAALRSLGRSRRLRLRALRVDRIRVMSGAPARLPSHHVRLWAHGFGQGYGARSCRRLHPRFAVSQVQTTQPQLHQPPRRPLRGRACQTAPCSIAVCGPEYAYRKNLRLQEEDRRARAQVVEAYREIAASTMKSRQGQYITTTIATMIRRLGGMCRAIRLVWTAASTLMVMLAEIRFLTLTQKVCRRQFRCRGRPAWCLQ